MRIVNTEHQHNSPVHLPGWLGEPRLRSRGLPCRASLFTSLLTIFPVLTATSVLCETTALAACPETISVSTIALATSTCFQGGFNAFVTRDFDKAVECFTAWSEAERESPDALVWLAKALAYQAKEKHKRGKARIRFVGTIRRVAKMYESALELDPDHFGALLGKAIQCRAVPGFLGGNKKESRRIFEELMRRDPESVYVQHAYALLLEALGEDERALRLERRVVTTPVPPVEHDPELAMKMGECFHQMGRLIWEHEKDAEGAAQYLERVTELWPFLPEAALLLGDIARARKEDAAAIRWYRLAGEQSEKIGDVLHGKKAARALRKYKRKSGLPQIEAHEPY